MYNKIILLFLVFLVTLNGVHALEDGVSIPLVADRSTDGGDEGVLLAPR